MIANKGLYILLTLAAMEALWEPAEDGKDTGEQRDVVVTATRAPIQAKDAPVTVSLKDADQIADELATDIKDLIRFEPGISVRRAPARFGAAMGTTGRAGNEGFVVRGIGGNRVLIQVDGVRVPYGFSFGAQDVGRGDYVDLGLIRSVEFLRGPASALYGSDGLAGAVSFTTGDPVDILGAKAFGGSLRTQYNSADDEYTQSAVVAGQSGVVSAMLAYTRRDFSELKAKGDVEGTGVTRTAPNPQDGRSNALMGKLVWNVAPGHRLRATGEYLDNRVETDVLTGINASVAGLKARDTSQRWRGALDWTYDGAGLVQFARAAVYVQDAENRQFSAEDRRTLADRTRLNTLENRVYGGSGEVRLGFATGGISHRLVTGADISMLRQRGLRDGTVPPCGRDLPDPCFPQHRLHPRGRLCRRRDRRRPADPAPGATLRLVSPVARQGPAAAAIHRRGPVRRPGQPAHRRGARARPDGADVRQLCAWFPRTRTGADQPVLLQPRLRLYFGPQPEFAA